jgi:ADP-ribose pyrophosphatase YjhB (NUDIX family)
MRTPVAASAAEPPPRVSLVMAVYNAAPYLAASIESVLAQSYRNWEMLLIDDGSTDDSTAIARRYAAEHPQRIRYLSHPGRANRGVSATRNLGTAHARGEFIAVQDADDLSEPRRLEFQVTFLDSQPDIGLVGVWYTAIDESDRPLGVGRMPSDHLDLRWALLLFCPFVHSGVMVRRSVLLESGPYSESLRYAHDYDLWVRVASRYRVANLPLPLVRYRTHRESLTSTYGERSREETRLKAELIGRLLGWEDPASDAKLACVDAMTALILGWGHRYDAAVFAAAVDELPRLHAAFAAEAGLRQDQAQRQWTQARSLISRNLIVFARRCRRDDPANARRMFRQAARLHLPTALRPRSLVSAARLAWS